MTRCDVIAYVTWVGKWHHSTFSLNSFLVLSFDTKMSHLKRRWKVLWANQCYGNLPFILINVSFRKTISLKTFPWIFPHPNFMTNTITSDVSNGVNVRFVHPCAKVMALFFKCKNFQTLTFSNFLNILAFQTDVLVSIYLKFHWNRP